MRGRKPAVRYWQRQGGGYFATLRGRKVLLALGPDDAPTGPTYLAALETFAREMRLDAGRGTNKLSLYALLAAYAKHVRVQGRVASARNISSCLDPFATLHGDVPVCDLKGWMVREWLRDSVTWGPSTKRLASTLLQVALNWGVRDGLIESNPLKGKVETPRDKPRGREALIEDPLADLLSQHAGLAFASLLRVWRATGCRPEEAELATAAHFREDKIVYPWQGEAYGNKQAKRGKRVDRVIYLTPDLAALFRALAKQHPTGPLLRTPKGRPWRKGPRGRAWERTLAQEPVEAYLREAGRDRATLVPYGFRHTFISRWIDAGLSIKLCADLCGTSVAAIERTYGHSDSANLQRVFLLFSGTPQAIPPS